MEKPAGRDQRMQVYVFHFLICLKCRDKPVWRASYFSPFSGKINSTWVVFQRNNFGREIVVSKTIKCFYFSFHSRIILHFFYSKEMDAIKPCEYAGGGSSHFTY